MGPVASPYSRPRRWLAAVLAGLALIAPLVVAAADRTNIPLKNWGGFAVSRDAVYDDLERLVTAGLAGRTILGTKPMSRIEAARIVARAIETIRRDDEGAYNARRDLEPVIERLTEEFRSELRPQAREACWDAWDHRAVLVPRAGDQPDTAVWRGRPPAPESGGLPQRGLRGLSG